MARHLASVSQLYEVISVRGPYAHGALRQELRTESGCLHKGTPGQVSSAQSGRKAKIVLDPGTGAGLPAGSLGLDHQGAQALRTAIDGSRQPRRPCPNHHHVIDIL